MVKKILKWSVAILLCIFSINIVVVILDIGLLVSKYMPDQFLNIFIDKSRVFEITEYLDLWFSVINIVITAILSWSLLKVSKKSNDISEQISHLEESRDKKELNDNISFIYYQIIHSFKELHKLYIDYFIINKTDYRQIKIHSDWITTLSKLQSVLSISEIDNIYQLFVDIETVNNTKDNQKAVVISIYKKYMLSCFFDARNNINLQEIDPLTMLHPEMISTILFLLYSFKKNDLLIEEKNSKVIISETDYNWFNGEIEFSKGKFSGIVKLTYKNIKMNAKFSKNRFVSGEIKAYYENTWKKLYNINYKTNNDFHAKLYTAEENVTTGKLVVDADYTDNVFDIGFLTFKKGNEIWEGTVKYNGHNFDMIDGIIHHRLIEDSTREYNYDAEERWINEQLEKQNDPEYIEALAAETTNEQPLGYKVFEDFVYENGRVVRRENKTKENKYTYL